MEMSHLTIGEIDEGYGLRGEYGNSVAAANNILCGIGMDSDDYAMLWTNNPGNSSDYNVLYSNTNNYCTQHGAHPGLHDLCSENGNAIDPLTGSPGSGIPSLKYLPRIEDGGDLDCAASDGGDIGATIMYRIGRDGTLWGEEGYDEMTDKPLWPFPNENMIKEQMRTYSYDNGNLRGDRGFCADGTGLYGGPITLTSYIWEYLGSPCPPEICNCSAQDDVCGDLNGDGVVTTADAVIALEIAAGGSAPYDPAADVDGDGVVTSLDVLMIRQAAAGQIEIC
jgi:hypothetical protein